MKKIIFLIFALITVTIFLVGCEVGDRRNPIYTPGNGNNNARFGNDRNRNGNGFYDPDVNPFVRTPEVRNPIITPNVPNNYPNGNVRHQKREPNSVNVRPGMDFIKTK